MPVIPMVRQKDWGGARIPTVMSADAAPLARGGRALARGISDLGQAAAGIAGVAERVKERKTREEVDSMLADYDERETYAWNGRPGEAGAEPVRGVRDWGEGDGSAAEAMQAVWKEWRDNPEGLYAKASPEARRRVDRALRARTARTFSLAAQKDVAAEEARQRAAAEAALAASGRSAMMCAGDDELFDAAASDASHAAARLKTARLIANPGEPDPDRLVFRSEDGRRLYDAARAEALDKLRYDRARTLAEGAGVAESEAEAAAGIMQAAGVAESLPPALKPAALNLIETVRARRLDGMLGLARAEPDLDKRERLLQTAERSAKDYGAGGKLLGAVAEEARRARAEAQREENRLAMAALAEGKEYEPGENPRMKAALDWARPRIEKARQAEQKRTLSGNEEFLGAMIAAGAWFGGDGELRALTLDESRSLLRAQLADGNIRPARYLAEKARLDKIEASGMKARYERAAAEVNAALGEEIKTLWAGSEATLAAGEDPSRKVAKYTFEETKRELVPETETVTAYRGGILFGIPSTQTRRTGRMVEKVTTVRRKRELLAADVTKAINLLMRADEANGLMVDLDGNPATPAEKLDARAYKAKLVADIKARQLAADLDAQAAGIFEAVSARARDRRVLEAAAMASAAGMRLPAEEDDDTEEDDAD